jgi:uncharacterized protein YbjT (DUF2867 family)
VARILIVAGGCRGRQLAAALAGEGHAVRVTTRAESGRAAIEASGAECYIGTPQRLATLRAALDGVTVICWLLGTAAGPEPELRSLHSTRLEFFLGQVIDTTARGFVYEAAGATASAALLAAGERRARTLLELNAIPARYLTVDPDDPDAWLAQARRAVASLLGVG